MRGFTPDDLADLLGRADGHRALVDNDLEPVHGLRDFARDAEHVLQVRGAVFALGRADRNEDHRRGANRPGQLRRERQALFRHVPAHEFFEAWLEDRHLSLAQHPDLGGVLVDADDVVAGFREAGARDQPHVASPDDGELHRDISTGDSTRTAAGTALKNHESTIRPTSCQALDSQQVADGRTAPGLPPRGRPGPFAVGYRTP